MILRLIIAVALFAAFLGPRAHAQAESCPKGSVFEDDGSVSGCVKTEKSRKNLIKRHVGRWIARDKDSNIVYDVSYDGNGQEHGRSSTFHRPDPVRGIANSVRDESYFIHGHLEGVFRSYYPNGNLKELAHYRNGQLHGLRTRFTYEGKPQGEECWLRDVRQAHESCDSITYKDEIVENGFTVKEVPFDLVDRKAD